MPYPSCFKGSRYPFSTIDLLKPSRKATVAAPEWTEIDVRDTRLSDLAAGSISKPVGAPGPVGLLSAPLISS